MPMAPVGPSPRLSRMQVGIALKLREAFKRRFEVRASATIPNVSKREPIKVWEKLTADDDYSIGENPFEDLSKTPRSKDSQAVNTTASLTVGYRDECITVDARKNKKDQWVVVKGNDAFETSDEPKKKGATNSALDPYCLVVTRRFAVTGKLEAIVLTIQSSVVVRAIRQVVKHFPDQTFRVGDTIECQDPPQLIYHHRKELAQYQAQPGLDDKTKLHLDFLFKFLYTHMAEQIATYKAFLAAGMVRFGDLWMMFKPGTYVFERDREQLYRYLGGEEGIDACGRPSLHLNCERVDYNGKTLGLSKHTIYINKFENQRAISSLAVIPLDMHYNPERLLQQLRERGTRFLQLRGMHVLQHVTKGRVVVDASTCMKRIQPGNEDLPQSLKRGIIISEKCECICAVCRDEVEETPKDYDHDAREIADDLLLLCTSTVLGFTLGSHEWVQMRVEDLSEVQWSPDAIDRLVLDKRQKKVLSSLISAPVFNEGMEGDVIGWKGKGLVMLMHGAPGTGKTLTAESVCESLKRPLYIVNGGELGVSPEIVEKQLRDILELSKLWKAVILIDEADVFLEARSAQDIVRNNFVSGSIACTPQIFLQPLLTIAAVFLRRLEYFEGILMLTTNRVEQFDEAFISRIHLAINYPELEPWMRKQIWINALTRFPREQLAIDVHTQLEDIAKVPLNGRVISYAVRTAKAIADEDNSKLTLEHLWDVVSVQQRFNHHLRQKQDIAARSLGA